MWEQVIDLSESIVDIIYSPDQEGLDQSFLKLMDLFMAVIEEKNINLTFLNQELLNMQTAYAKKDYGELADILHYDLVGKLKGML